MKNLNEWVYGFIESFPRWSMRTVETLENLIEEVQEDAYTQGYKDALKSDPPVWDIDDDC